MVRLRTGGYQHPDERVGWVQTPVFVVFGKTSRDSAAKPDTSTEAILDDEIPGSRLATSLEIRLALRAKGYSPVPCKGKAPCISEWQTKHESSEAEIRAWPGGNTGILTERTTTLDIDILDPDAAQYVEELVRDMFDEAGTVLVRSAARLSERSRCARTSRSPRSCTASRPPRQKHKIEVLGEGQQVIVAGRHPETKKPYSWHGTELWNVPHDDLPATTEGELIEFLDTVAELSWRAFRLCALHRGTQWRKRWRSACTGRSTSMPS